MLLKLNTFINFKQFINRSNNRKLIFNAVTHMFSVNTIFLSTFGISPTKINFYGKPNSTQNQY